jgi:hypothetical protein
MDAALLLGQILFVVAVFALLVRVGVKLVRYAKKGTPGAQVLGAAFLLSGLFGIGNFRDPTNDIVHQAQRLKRREEDDAGDPPEHGGDHVSPATRR